MSMHILFGFLEKSLPCIDHIYTVVINFSHYRDCYGCLLIVTILLLLPLAAVGTIHATVRRTPRGCTAPFLSSVAMVRLCCCINFGCQACCQLGRHRSGPDHHDH